ncbi:MAG: hypothetical protein RLZZ521_1512, partial [Pseudomonadota bacterium]
MRLSFRIVLFLNILIASAIIIIANRVAIQVFLPLQIKEQLKNELINYVEECGQYLPHRENFQACIQSSESISLIKGFTGRYVLCSEQILTQQNEACSTVLNGAIKWDAITTVSGKLIQYADAEISKAEWLAANYYGKAKERTVVILSLEEVSLEISRMLRAYRDRNTIYVLPILMLLILLMTWHVFNVAMRPIKQIDQSIKTLDLKTFDIKTALVAPYKEFLTIVDSFEALRLKLIQSFDKARR